MNPYNIGNKRLFKLVFYHRPSVLVSQDILKKKQRKAKVLQFYGTTSEQKLRKQRRKHTNTCLTTQLSFKTKNRKSIQIQQA